MGQITVNQRGVTLVESMVALLIFLIVSVGYMSLEANLAKSSGQTQLVSQAVFIGQTKIDALRQLADANLVSSAEPEIYDKNGTLNPVDEDGLLYSVSWTVTTPEDTPTLRRVRVEVSWNLESEFEDAIQLYFVRSQ